MPATLFRAVADAAVSTCMNWPDERPACALAAPASTAEAAAPRTAQPFGVLVCVWRAVSPGHANHAPAIRSLPFRDEEDALTWEDAAWQ